MTIYIEMGNRKIERPLRDKLTKDLTLKITLITKGFRELMYIWHIDFYIENLYR